MFLDWLKNLLGVKKEPLPNFSAVDTNGGLVLRGGQPTDEGWRRLFDMGINNVVKLNEDDEGKDTAAERLGMRVQKFPVDTDDQLFGVRQGKVDSAVEAIKSGTYVHCLHGEDRTGVVCYFYRRKEGWSKADALAELMSHGFHKSLHGLWELIERDPA